MPSTPPGHFCGAKVCSFTFEFFENSNAVHQCQLHVLLFSPSSPPLIWQLDDLLSATLAASSGLLHEKPFQPQRLFLTTHQGSEGLQSQGKRKSKHRCLTGPDPQLGAAESAHQGVFSEDIRSLISYLGLKVMGPAEQWQPEPALPRRETRKKLNPFLSMSPKLLTQRKVFLLLLFH